MKNVLVLNKHEWISKVQGRIILNFVVSSILSTRGVPRIIGDTVL